MNQKCLYCWWIFKKIYILFFRLGFLSIHVFMGFFVWKTWYLKKFLSKLHDFFKKMFL